MITGANGAWGVIEDLKGNLLTTWTPGSSGVIAQLPLILIVISPGRKGAEQRSSGKR
jgi:hypothetical protein